MAMNREPPCKAAIPKEVIADLERRFLAFPAPQSHGDFPACAASPAVLRQLGLPPRPEADRPALLRDAWDRAFAKPIRLQQFVFDPRLVEDTHFRLQSGQADEMDFSGSRFETSSNWSGAYITANQNRRFLQIWGSWTIPGALKLPPAPLRGPAEIPYVCSNWIGLDGQRLYFNSSLPQMGTVSTLQPDGTTTAQAWTQWWARGNSDSVPLPLGLTVTPGDQILCILTVLDPHTVAFLMVNLTTGAVLPVKGTAPTVTMPDGSKLQPGIAGATAEWIVERPRVLGGAKPCYNFPDYGETGFGLCVAVEGTQMNVSSLPGGLLQVLHGARRIRMFQTLPDPARTEYISMPRTLNDTSFRVTYGGF